ncbi:MAG: alpha-E domain-containing protein [bacterium]|nr:alpha-E domain-containing protein [bacterium]
MLGEFSVLSRVADSIYWMNRYLERVENYARFIDANRNLTLDLPPGMVEQWQPLIQATGDQELFQDLYDQASRENVLRFLIEDRENPSSIRSCLYRARENARSVREMLSLEIYEQINECYLRSRDAMGAGPNGLDAILADPVPFCTMIKEMSHLYYGLFYTTLSHGEGWQFGMLGQQLERSDQTTRLLDVKYFILLPTLEDIGRSFDLLQWSSVLKSASAYEMYSRVFDRIEPRSIIRYLIFDRDFPRSILFCVVRAAMSLQKITGSREGSFVNSPEKSLMRLRSDLEYSEVKEVFDIGMHEYLDGLQQRLNAISSGLHEAYFRIDPETGR